MPSADKPTIESLRADLAEIQARSDALRVAVNALRDEVARFFDINPDLIAPPKEDS